MEPLFLIELLTWILGFNSQHLRLAEIRLLNDRRETNGSSTATQPMTRSSAVMPTLTPIREPHKAPIHRHGLDLIATLYCSLDTLFVTVTLSMRCWGWVLVASKTFFGKPSPLPPPGGRARTKSTGVPASQMGRCLPYDTGSRKQLMHSASTQV